MNDELPGLLYLGRTDAPRAPLLFQSRQLTTHAVVLGMTGSGKTGLSIAMLEEAALDGIPVLAIDPKGDLGNLALTFPSLAGEDYAGWVDPEEARRRGLSTAALAEETAAAWRAGLASWEQPPERIARLRAAAEVRIYTPGSSAGEPLALLGALTAPPAGDDEDALRERLVTTVSGLLGLLGVGADPLQSREHALLSRILLDAWGAGRAMDLAELVAAIQRPPFTRVGALDVDSFFPAKDRAALAMALNTLLASPAAATWFDGPALDVDQLLRTADGRPRIAIVSIAHLGDAERMFVVSSLLAELVSWMRRQGGTSSLRALCFMDEIAGYFPPTANPPSKPPMLTLLKQARAFGLGVVLATQNPVDLDYKGLSNCGTWFLGRLQTERDKLRVLDGLEGASTAGFDRATMDRTLSALAPRRFLLHSVHAAAPVLFETRWTLSYLRGPVTREEIKRLRRAQGAGGPGSAAAGAASPGTPLAGAAAPGAASASAAVPGAASTAPAAGSTRAGSFPATAAPAGRPPAPVDLEERFTGEGATYAPHVHVAARVHYVDARAGVDAWEDVRLVAPIGADGPDWSGARVLDGTLESSPRAGAAFASAPPDAWRKGAAAKLAKSFATWAFQERPLRLPRGERSGVVGRPGEPVAAFRARSALALREGRDAAVSALQAKYAGRRAALAERVAKAEARLTKEQQDATAANLDTVATWGGAIFGALFGGGSAVAKVTRAARTTNRNLGAHDDVSAARAALADAQAAERALAEELEAAVREVGATWATDPEVTVEVKPRKADTDVQRVMLVWVG